METELRVLGLDIFFSLRDEWVRNRPSYYLLQH